MADSAAGSGTLGPSDDEQDRVRLQREAARRRLLQVEPGNARDLDAAATCECSCHPRPGDPDRHRGGLCPCQWTDEERATHLAELDRLMEEHRPEQEAFWRERAEALVAGQRRRRERFQTHMRRMGIRSSGRVVHSRARG